jgi:hypothetical protein
MTVLNKSEIEAVHGGIAWSEVICTIAEIRHMASEGFSALQDAISDILHCYNDSENWESFGFCVVKLVPAKLLSAGISLAATAIYLKKAVETIRVHQRVE